MAHWNHRQRSIADILWPSFLAACFATMLFFALFDPEALQYALPHDFTVSHVAIYTIGFFFFWLVGAIASTITTWLIRTERRKAEFPEPPQGQ